MKLELILSDISRNRVTTAVTILFIVTAAISMPLAAGLATSLTDSIDRLMEDTRAPHFI